MSSLPSHFAKEERPIVGDSEIPLRHITSFGVATVAPSFTRQAMVTMTFTAPGGILTLWSTFVEGQQLVDQMRQLVAMPPEAAGGIADNLARLSTLTRDGMLTTDEFERAKASYLGQPPDKQTEAIELIRQLHGLVQAGVLTQGEFNMKKWDVLSR